MYLTSDKKKELFAKHGNSETNTGSAEGQIALFSFRIAHLTEHLKKNHNDFGTQRALISLVGKRRRLLDYRADKVIQSPPAMEPDGHGEPDLRPASTSRRRR